MARASGSSGALAGPPGSGIDAPFQKWLDGKLAYRLLVIAVAAALLVGWEAASTAYGLKFWVSTPSAIAGTVYKWFVGGYIYPHILATLEALLYGFAIGTLLAFVASFVFYQFPRMLEVVDPFIVGLISIPSVALAPIFIIWFGIGLTSKVVLAAKITFFLMFYQILSGLREVPRGMINAFHVMGGTRWALIRKIQLPASRTWILHGFRLAFPKAFTGVIVGEIIGANRGIGYLTRYYAGTFDTTSLLAAASIILAMSIAMYYAFGRLGSDE
jgi:NitT/TauT family transport system permease protein